MRRCDKSDSAEVGTSSMIIFITLILASSIMSAILLGMGDNIFKRTQHGAEKNVPAFRGITNVVVLEIFTLGADDELHIVFELPYVENSVPEEDLSWAIMCYEDGDAKVEFDEGNFALATELSGDGRTAGAITEFDPGVDYRMIITLSDSCNLEDVQRATMILLVDKGRTLEKTLDIGDAPYQGQDLN